MWAEAFLGAFIGSVMSLIISVIIENQRKPRLSIKIEDPPVDEDFQEIFKDDIEDFALPANKARFLRVQLWNDKLPKLFQWLSRESAMHCNAELQFLHFDDLAPVFYRNIPARWAGADEPYSPQLDQKTRKVIQIFDPSKYNAAFRRNCHPGTKETIDVVARFDQEKECYVWTNDYVLKGWRNPETELPRGRYYVIVTVYSSGEKIQKIFKLENSVSIKDFRLLDLSNEDEKRLSKYM